MSRYAIGDLQGCHQEFVELLEALSFDPRRDELWLAGDLVNRGPGSLDCLRDVMALGSAAKVVLGNHDLHLLAVARGGASLKRKDTLDDILAVPDRDTLLDWLQARPLLLRDGEAVMTHAGLPPQWSVEQAEGLAGEVSWVLTGEQSGDFLSRMYGNRPRRFKPHQEGVDRYRAIVNTLTRMRFIDAEGRLDFDAKEGLDSAPEGFSPWFQYPRADDPWLLFGHWAALNGTAPDRRVRAEALDTGCVWGGSLTALDMASGERISVPSRQQITR
ncbi:MULTISPECIES: symmetrical bis(5'-nucleosyl)-tetraphosphatase [Halomonas]|uniref:symmetrical bis(5'-nucleosyl)-tetraphosphatase n=1 Tax=Halomonas TaxID=2745 RepID=UPI001A8F3272|nr:MULTISPECIES: symmetrical bis(5'-nucleosyl)-tetraphosphatase [Halomonas]MBN8412311.1 symmetrical bis(5'-nucleosyl)-tetraphosphatase [Halomonas litopenaei]MBY5924587.1 symmetrical bis(5'-nucleosyl)-tetraphosphatase [Halomonas sp. DP4Y7-2]MBY6231629.1 symmetrical bis(5'-nucleosyl)-tetraphosphatase [Halomonas sp. DP4Y7-1]